MMPQVDSSHSIMNLGNGGANGLTTSALAGPPTGSNRIDPSSGYKVRTLVNETRLSLENRTFLKN